VRAAVALPSTRSSSLFWVIVRVTVAPPSTRSSSLFYEIIKVVSNGHGPRSLTEVIFCSYKFAGSVCSGWYQFPIPRIAFFSFLLARL
jgi:hypothetical protein